MVYPFEVSLEQLQANLDDYVTAIFHTLQSEFMALPRGEGFVDYPTFLAGYETLRQTTRAFSEVSVDSLTRAVQKRPLAFVVIRTILGFTPPEWAYLANQRTSEPISQGYARSLDRDVRMTPERSLGGQRLQSPKLHALLLVAADLITHPPTSSDPEKIHRLDKADTREGLVSLQSTATLGVPYAMLLYERLLGRPFAGHRDSISELIGDGLEELIETTLIANHVTFRKTKRAEKLPGFEQAPDFIIPDEFDPQVIIEAKITEDDGTARDKVARILRLVSMADERLRQGQPSFQVVACLAGRGFGVRREDMRQLLLATKGKVFTPNTIDYLVDTTLLAQFKT